MGDGRFNITSIHVAVDVYDLDTIDSDAGVVEGGGRCKDVGERAR